MMSSWRGISCAVVVVLSTLLAHQARADFVVSIDADPLTDGIQSSRVVGIGENFTVDIIGSIDGLNLAGNPSAATSVSSYAVSVQYDTVPLNTNPTGSTAAATEFLPPGFEITWPRRCQ